MIFLIDDTPLNDVNGEFVLDDKYKKVLCYINSIEQYKKEKDSIINADCVLVHGTFDNSQIVKEQMLDLCDDGDEKPIVIFSGGDSSVDNYDKSKEIHCIEHINKALFYERLEAFLDYNCENKSIDLRIIAEGKGYISREINRCAIVVKKLLNTHHGVITSEDAIALKNSEELSMIIHASQPAIGMSRDRLVDILSTITYEQIRENINQIVISFSQYGKNIYPWK